jgi:hypothetical protein
MLSRTRWSFTPPLLAVAGSTSDPGAVAEPARQVHLQRHIDVRHRIGHHQRRHEVHPLLGLDVLGEHERRAVEAPHHPDAHAVERGMVGQELRVLRVAPTVGRLVDLDPHLVVGAGVHRHREGLLHGGVERQVEQVRPGVEGLAAIGVPVVAVAIIVVRAVVVLAQREERPRVVVIAIARAVLDPLEPDVPQHQLHAVEHQRVGGVGQGVAHQPAHRGTGRADRKVERDLGTGGRTSAIAAAGRQHTGHPAERRQARK